jgi:hypothetical protein
VAVVSFSSETWASTSPGKGEALSNDVSKLTAATDGSQLAIHGNLVFAGSAFPAGPVSVRVCPLKDLRCLGDVRSLGRSAAVGTKAVYFLTSNQVPTLSRTVSRSLHKKGSAKNASVKRLLITDHVISVVPCCYKLISMMRLMMAVKKVLKGLSVWVSRQS